MAEPEQAPHAEGRQAFHLPPPSIWPPVMALGIALILTGLVVNRVLLVIGVILGLIASALWVRGAVNEFRSLPE